MFAPHESRGRLFHPALKHTLPLKDKRLVIYYALRQCLLEVGDQVVDILDAHRQPQQRFGDSEFLAYLKRH